LNGLLRWCFASRRGEESEHSFSIRSYSRWNR
jgi:hypothetical protein